MARHDLPVSGPPLADPEALLAPLDPQQRQAATAVEGPVCVLAGAGTGKTRALTHRVAYGVATGAFLAEGVLAVTFTTRAAAEMRGRLARLGVPGVSSRTFHSAALSQMRYFWPRLYGIPFPAVQDSPEHLLAALAEAEGITGNVRDLAGEIAWAKVSNIAATDYAERALADRRRLVGATPAQLARLYTRYTDALTRVGRLDLEDVLLAAVGVLETQPAAARAVRRRYRWFVVDEFQDVSGLQHRLLECWLGERDDVCVVGDPRQAIYSFAGARAQFLREFPSRFPGTTTVELTRNYRSVPEVLAVAAAVGADAGPGPRLSAVRESARTPVTIIETDSDSDEADTVAAQVRHDVDAGTPERDVAVLARTHAELPRIVRALAERGLRVAVRGGTPFYERPEVRQLLALLAAAARRGPGGDSVSDRVEAVMVDAGWTSGRPASARESARWESWAAVLAAAREWEAGAAQTPAETTLTGLVDHLREQAHVGAEPKGAGVTVATLHATKGQEWSSVVVVGAHDGGIPSAAAVPRLLDGPAMREEQRLLYVGLTRARDQLRVTWAARRGPGQGRPRRPSRFIAPLLEGSCAPVEVQRQAEARSGSSANPGSHDSSS